MVPHGVSSPGLQRAISQAVQPQVCSWGRNEGLWRKDTDGARSMMISTGGVTFFSSVEVGTCSQNINVVFFLGVKLENLR